MDNNCMNSHRPHCANPIPYRHPDFSRPVTACAMPSVHSHSLVVGMAYVPFQTFGNLYDTCKGLKQGTIFPELDKPFIGGCRR